MINLAIIKTKSLSILTILLGCLFLTTIVSAQTSNEPSTDSLPLIGERSSIPRGVSNENLYSCEGGRFGSVGMSRARGAFVPVSDQAVTTNTNILLYKECILDGVVARLRESMIAKMAKDTLEMASGAATGDPAFITDLSKTKKDIKRDLTKTFVEGKRTEGICEPYKEEIKKTLLLQTTQEIEEPEAVYKCTVPKQELDEFENFASGKGRFKKDLYLKYISPSNNPLLVYLAAKEQLDKDIKEKVENELTVLGWGDGFKSKISKRRIPSGNGEYEEVEEIVTPGVIIRDIISYTSLTGQRQLENADEADELIGSLMGNLHTQILTSVRGLKGIADSINGGLSFLDMILANTSSRARDQYTNMGSGLLANAIIAESEYNAARKASLRQVMSAIKDLQVKDEACWDSLTTQAKTDLLSKVKTSDAKAIINTDESITFYGDDPLTDTQEVTSDIEINILGGGNHTVTNLLRTNKYYLSAIADQLLPLLSTIQQDVEDSEAALEVLNGLQTELAKAKTQKEAERILAKINTLVSSGSLHKSADVRAAQEQHTQIRTFLEELQSDIFTDWEQTWCDPAKWKDQIKN